jgi:hypothetical protein
MKAAAGDWLSLGNMNGFVASPLYTRPGMNIVHAVCWPFFDKAIEAYYPYMTTQ